MGFLAGLRSKYKSSQTAYDDNQLSPYSNFNSSLTEFGHCRDKRTKKEIKAADTPRWLSSEKKCREWLTAVCIKYLNLTEEQSKEIAQKFTGMGSILYAFTYEDWEGMFPEPRHGASVYNILFALRREEGAVPKSVAFAHWSRRSPSPREENVRLGIEGQRWIAMYS